ncbi:MAG TPA: hypothetical protein VFE47_02080 [Tepidisphaeraceae bacterium]|jgi:hypothetical protein|nr:hypothetical protein [Tepidisphaeraceae bacterium]
MKVWLVSIAALLACFSSSASFSGRYARRTLFWHGRDTAVSAVRYGRGEKNIKHGRDAQCRQLKDDHIFAS